MGRLQQNKTKQKTNNWWKRAINCQVLSRAGLPAQRGSEVLVFPLPAFSRPAVSSVKSAPSVKGVHGRWGRGGGRAARGLARWPRRKPSERTIRNVSNIAGKGTSHWRGCTSMLPMQTPQEEQEGRTGRGACLSGYHLRSPGDPSTDHHLWLSRGTCCPRPTSAGGVLSETLVFTPVAAELPL